MSQNLKSVTLRETNKISKSYWFIAFVLSLCSLHAHTQTVYFDSLYDSGTHNPEGIWKGGTVEINDGYFTLGYVLYPNDEGKLLTFQIDYEGNLVSLHELESASNVEEISGNLLQINDSIFIALSYYGNLDQPGTIQGDFCLTQFNIGGDTIWKKVYGKDTLQEIPQFFIRTTDNGYAIIGQSIVEANNGDVYLIKTDSSGNFEWEQYYGGGAYDSGSSLLQTEDNGFMMLGWTRSFGAGQRDFYLIKTDSIGNQQWQRTYGGGNNDSGQHIIKLSDNNYLLCGASALTSGVGRLIKIDNLGNIIWNKTYHYDQQPSSEIFWAIELEDGSIISTGITDKQGESNAGWLLKADSAGNMLWQRKYNKNYSIDLFYDVIKTSDNGFLLSGFAFNLDYNNQDAWLLKVDSIGCAYEDCTVGIEEEIPLFVIVYPNPAKTEITVSGYSPSYLKLVNTVGQTVSESKSNKVSVADLSDGLYVLQMFDAKGQQVKTEKVIVAH